MNLPNKITVSRVLLIPVFMVFMLVDFDLGTITVAGTEMMKEHLIGGLIFIIASITDWLDGYIARKNESCYKYGEISRSTCG